jgi:hypothetical protein
MKENSLLRTSGVPAMTETAPCKGSLPATSETNGPGRPRALLRAIVMSTTVLVASLALAQVPTVPAFAASQVNTSGKFTIWVPDDWQVTVNGKRTTAENDELSLVVGPLIDKTVALADDDVKDFVGDEINNIKVTADRFHKHEGFEVRVLEGAGDDDGDPILFRSLALSLQPGGRVIQALVYGDPEEMNRPEARATVERILLSLRPQGHSDAWTPGRSGSDAGPFGRSESNAGPFGRPVPQN